MNAILVTPPATFPVTLDEAKNFLRVDGSEDDDLINGAIATATQLAEAWTKRAFITQGWEVVLDQSPAGALVLPKPPLVEVASVTVIGDDGGETIVPPDTYWADRFGRLMNARGHAWPHHRGFASFIVAFTAGYGLAASVPAPIKQAILQAVGHLYANREAQELPPGAETLLRPYLVYRM